MTSPTPASEMSSSKLPFKLMRRSSLMLADSVPQDVSRKVSLTVENRSSIRQFTGSPSQPSVNIASTNGNGMFAGNIDETVPLLGNSSPVQPSGWRSIYTFDWQKVHAFFTGRLAKNVYKCALAYLIGSMAVYSPLGGYLYGHSDNKHLMATSVAYFHPARTAGSMTEALMFVVISLAFSLINAANCMFISVYLIAHDLRWLAYTVDLIVFCGLLFGFIAYVKRKVNLPTFNTASSLACIFLASILIREGNVQAGRLSFYKLFQSYMLVVSGCLVSSLICYILWPQSAVLELKKALNSSFDYKSELLKHISEAFLAGDDVMSAEFDNLLKTSATQFSALDSILKDAQKELYVRGQEMQYRVLQRLVKSDHRLSLHLRGLLSSAKIQWHLLQHDDDEAHTLAEIPNYKSLAVPVCDSCSNSESEHSSQSLFNTFSAHLGPPMRSFYISLREILDKLPFEDDASNPATELDRLRVRLSLDSDLYSKAREKALQELYSLDAFKSEKLEPEASADAEGVAASCGNFSYVLEDYGNELKVFMEALEEFQNLTINPLRKSYSWVKTKWPRSSNLSSRSIENTVQRFFGGADAVTMKTREKPSFGLRLWRSLRAFRTVDLQFAIKVGFGALVFSIPAFLSSTRPLFTLWRGEWGLTVYCIIMNKSVGGTSVTVWLRFLGTLIGASVAYFSWILFPKNPYALATIGLGMSVICFYIILTWKEKNPFGRFILLTFNLVCMYSYSLSIADDDDDDDEGGVSPMVFEIAFHRFASVVAGVIWALLISTLIWPNSARKRLRRILSILWLRMGLVWKSDVIATNKIGGELRFAGIPQENELQTTVIELYSLLKEAPSELRLKGPFPQEKYQAALAGTQTILDAFQNISVLTSQYPKPTSRELELLDYTAAERQELCSRIFLLFYLNSSALKLGFPLPDKLPSTEHALDRMLVKLNDYRLRCIHQEKNKMSAVDEEDFVLLYSYILVTVTITEELSKIGHILQDLFGIIEKETLGIA